jgi:hypothetical protein
MPSAATELAVAGVGYAVVRVGATFPVASSLHVGAASRTADGSRRTYGGCPTSQRKDPMEPQTVIVIIAILTIAAIAWRIHRGRGD